MFDNNRSRTRSIGKNSPHSKSDREAVTGIFNGTAIVGRPPEKMYFRIFLRLFLSQSCIVLPMLCSRVARLPCRLSVHFSESLRAYAASSSSPCFSTLCGKSAIVTGGGSGIGQGIALGLAAEGVNVVVTGRRVDALQSTVDLAETLSGTVEPYSTDVVDRDQSALIEHVVEQHGRLDILVNNAGTNITNRALKDLSLDDWHETINTNLNGAFHMIHAALPQMRLQQDGLIVQITSIAGKRTLANLSGAAYCASKFAQQSLGSAINVEEHENGIRCTNIAPGEVVTPILDKRPQPPSQERRSLMLTPADVAAAVVMVAKLPKVAHVTEIVMSGKTTVSESVL